MTSREFYRTVDQVLRPSLEVQGFTRMRVSSSAWIKPAGEKFVLLQVEKGVKNPYMKPIGGQFHVWLHLMEKPNLSEAHYETSVSYLRYYSDNDLAGMKKIRQAILQKILSQTEFESEFDKTTLETFRPLMELGLGDDFNRRHPRPLEYLDSEDVITWARFIAGKVPATFDGVSKEGDSALKFS